MKRTIILNALISVFVFAGLAEAQMSSLRVSFSEAIGQNGVDTLSVNYTGLESPNARVFEAFVQGSATCLEVKQFSNAIELGPDRASLVYDAATATYKVQWFVKRDTRDGCRVLIVDNDGDTDGRDFLLWQRNIGVAGLVESEFEKSDSDARRGMDGSVRNISYQISVNPDRSQGLKLHVRNPGRDTEVIETGFQAPVDRIFSIFAASPKARSEAECLGFMNFTAAVPASPDDASVSYDPSIGYWFLKNSNPNNSTKPCNVLMVRGGVDITDLNQVRTNFGQSGGLYDDGSLQDDAVAEAGTARVGDRFTTTVIDPSY